MALLEKPAATVPEKPAATVPEKPAATAATLPDLSEYRTVETAISTRINRAGGAGPLRQLGYLGIYMNQDPQGRFVVAEVAVDSPAGEAGLQVGDILARVDGQTVGGPEALRSVVQAMGPGGVLKLSVLRKDKPVELSVPLGATSRPLKGSTQRAVLGVRLGDVREGEGVAIEHIISGMPAEAAGVKVGDILLKVNDVSLRQTSKLREILAGKKPGDTITLHLRREGKIRDIKVRLAAESSRDSAKEESDLTLWKKDLFRLAVVGIEYPDVKHNASITRKDWTDALFSRQSYSDRNNATGQSVHGSLNDYYQELSCGAFRVEGKVFDWVSMSKKRSEYAKGSRTGNPAALLKEALDRLLAREGKDTLKDFDGLFFLYAGERATAIRGTMYWPHRASITYRSKRWSYFISPEGGSRMTSISVFCHEFGHMLGLPDLYARPEKPNVEGVGVWCAMSNQIGHGRPQHFSAWCKEQLGWLRPTVIDPTVKQKLILSPIEGMAKECFKVLIQPDGSEYLLLENRRKKGFDQDLPGEGLMIWRVVQNRPVLEESHGVKGRSAPRVFLNAIPYPSPANNAFTPYTTPSSRSRLGGGLPVHITNIRPLPDGRVTFHIGYDFL
jgi:M6 family metalloprotease-like protein